MQVPTFSTERQLRKQSIVPLTNKPKDSKESQNNSTALEIPQRSSPLAPAVPKIAAEKQQMTMFSSSYSDKTESNVNRVSPLVKNSETECGSGSGLVKKLVDKYSKDCELAARPYVSPIREKSSPFVSTKFRTPIAKKRLQWPEESKASPVLEMPIKPLAFPVGNTEVQCDSLKDSTDSLNTTFDIDKPAIPNTPCIDDVTVKSRRRGSLGACLSQERSLPTRRSKRLSLSSSKKAVPCKLFANNSTKLSCIPTTKQPTANKLTELSNSQNDQINLFNFHLKSSPKAVSSDTGFEQRKRQLSVDVSPQRTMSSQMTVSSPKRMLTNKTYNRRHLISLKLNNSNQSCVNDVSPEDEEDSLSKLHVRFWFKKN